MKRILALLLTVLLLSIQAVSLAEGVIVLETPESKMQDIIDLSDIKNGQTLVINGYGEITFFDEGWHNEYGFFNVPGYNSRAYRYTATNTSEYYVLRVRILNTKYSAYNFQKDFSNVECRYGEGYKFGGVIEELSYRDSDFNSEFNMEYGTELSTDVLPLYQRDYAIIVTLPDVVKERTAEPLSISFTIGENEFTFNVRK